MSTSSSTYSGTSSSSSSSVHQPAAAYHPLTSSAPVTVTGSDGQVHHPGQSVRKGVSEIGTTVNHALASVAKGVGDALGLHHDQPAVIVSSHNPNSSGQLSSTAAHSERRHLQCHRLPAAAYCSHLCLVPRLVLDPNYKLTKNT